MKHFFATIFLFISIIPATAQSWKVEIKSNVEIRTWKLTTKVEVTEKSCMGASIKLLQDGKVIEQTTSDGDGDFTLHVPPKGTFIIEVSYPGCNTKRATVITEGVPDFGEEVFNPSFGIGGFVMAKAWPGIDYSALNQPLVKVVYVPRIKNFDDDQGYTDQALVNVGKISAAENALLESFCATNKAGDDAMKVPDCPLAKTLYEKAIKMIPGESYPVVQLTKVGACLKEKEEAEAKAKAEAEAKLAAEKAKKEKEEADRLAKEKAAKEKAEAEKLAKEKAEADRIAKEKETAAKAEADKLAKEKAAKEKEEAEKLAKEKAEADRIAKEKEAAAKAEADKLAKEKAAKEKEEAEKLAKEKAEADRIAKEKEAAAKAEADKLAKEKAAKEKEEADKLAKEKAAKDKAEADKIAKEKAEADRIAKEKEAAAKVEADKLAKEKEAKDKAEAEKLAKEKAEADKISKEKAKKEKEEADRIAKENKTVKTNKTVTTNTTSVTVGNTTTTTTVTTTLTTSNSGGELNLPPPPKDTVKTVTTPSVTATKTVTHTPAGSGFIVTDPGVASGDGSGNVKSKEINHNVRNELGPDKYKNAIKKADELFKTKRYKEAKAAYEDVLVIKPGDAYAKSKLEQVQKYIKP
ncbi:MAG TPA: hypothetical protein VGF30_06360 [Bacteroidia bacterium]